MGDTLSAIVSTGKRAHTQPALYVGLAGDAPQTPPARISLAGIERVVIGRGTQRTIVRGADEGAELVTVSLPDPRMSARHARLTRIGAEWIAEDLQSKNGTWIAGNAITRRPLEDGDPILVGHTMLVFRDHGGEAEDLDGAPRGAARGLATTSPGLAARFAELAEASRSVVPIEITGESGTGKELVAQAVHALSGRAGRFAAVNCGALTGSLLEGELFGHKKGAFTGAADDRLGLVRTADGGTLFLDEVAELPLSSQAALLRVLQEGEVVPVGSDRPLKVDLRLVTATHKNLDDEVAANRFRADLRARMLGFKLELPPLRDRIEDLGWLVSILLERIAPSRKLSFSSDAVRALYAYSWPLNIRELERTLAAAVAVAGGLIELNHIAAAVRTAPDVDADVDVDALSSEDRAIRDALVATMSRHDGNVAAVARELRKDPTQIRRWMKRFALSREDKR